VSAATGVDVALDDVRLRYGRTEALRGLSFRLEPGTVCGLLGRNGSGKTSLLSLLASRRRPTAGRITVGGVEPYECSKVMRHVALIGETWGGASSQRIDEAFAMVRYLRPRWDGDRAARLLDRFGLSPDVRISRLSRGQRAALGVTLGLASGAPVTLFDEAHLGMDAAARVVFYDELLDATLAGDRTVILSTHQIDEVARLFDDVVIIDRGRLVEHAAADDLRGRGTEVVGPAEAVDRFTAALTVLSARQVGTTKAVVVHGELGADHRRLAAELHLDLGPLPLQDLFIHLTEVRAS
jgi:ABC-2 type transport system ATP-binding protein